MNSKSWDQAAARTVMRIDHASMLGFIEDMFESHSERLKVGVSEGDEESLMNVCWSIGCEAARGLYDMGEWSPQEISQLLVRKQHDYGHDNILAFGQIGIAVRMSDKIARYYNLKKRGTATAANEPFIDCLKDMVGYGVIASMLKNGSFLLELEAA